MGGALKGGHPGVHQGGGVQGTNQRVGSTVVPGVTYKRARPPGSVAIIQNHLTVEEVLFVIVIIILCHLCH